MKSGSWTRRGCVGRGYTAAAGPRRESLVTARMRCSRTNARARVVQSARSSRRSALPNVAADFLRGAIGERFRHRQPAGCHAVLWDSVFTAESAASTQCGFYQTVGRARWGASAHRRASRWGRCPPDGDFLGLLGTRSRPREPTGTFPSLTESDSAVRRVARNESQFEIEVRIRNNAECTNSGGLPNSAV